MPPAAFAARRAATFAVALAATLPTGMTAAHAAGDAPTVRAKISAQSISEGQRVRLGGRVVGADRAGGRVVLQRRLDSGWQRLAVTRTNAQGGYRFVMRPAAGRHVFRARALPHAGQRPDASPARWVRVAAADQRAGSPGTTADALAGVRRAILDATNAARRRNGLDPLRAKAGLDSVAQRWSAAMAADGELAHNPSYADQIPDGWTRAAENVAYGYEPSEVVAAWMDSPGHRANILGDHTHLGIGYVRDAQGRAWFTQNFARY